MKKIIALIMTLSLCFMLAACGSNTAEPEETEDTSAEETQDTTQADDAEEETTADTSDSAEGAKTLVVYFSATGTTKGIAESIVEATGADTFEIVPAEPYTDADLDYNDDSSRSTQEMNDPSARPEITGSVENIEQYDTIYIGYPIWWGEAPRVMDTFVESYDFADKTIIPFCTSASSGIGSSAENLSEVAGSGNWQAGERFSGSESAEEIASWVASL